MWWWASPLNTRFTEYCFRVLNIEQLFFSIYNLNYQSETRLATNLNKPSFLVLVLMIRRYSENLLMFLKDKSGRTLMDHAKTELEAVRNWEYFGCGWIPGKEPVYRFKGKWSSIIDDINILSFINKLCSFQVLSHHQNHDSPLTTS